jgi:hypothetical protein
MFLSVDGAAGIDIQPVRYVDLMPMMPMMPIRGRGGQRHVYRYRASGDSDDGRDGLK